MRSSLFSLTLTHTHTLSPLLQHISVLHIQSSPYLAWCSPYNSIPNRDEDSNCTCSSHLSPASSLVGTKPLNRDICSYNHLSKSKWASSPRSSFDRKGLGFLSLKATVPSCSSLRGVMFVHSGSSYAFSETFWIDTHMHLGLSSAYNEHRTSLRAAHPYAFVWSRTPPSTDTETELPRKAPVTYALQPSVKYRKRWVASRAQDVQFN